MENRLKLAVCQLRTELAQEETMAKAERMVAEAARNGAQIVVLPEMFNCPYAREYFRPYARRGHAAAVAAMSRWARENGVLLVGGSVPELEGEKLYNTCFVFDEEGRQIARHRKVHLFDVDLPGMRFMESHSFAPGGQITTFETRWGTMGAAICFDIRFPELFRAMARRGAQIIFLPAQFNQKTGPAHWELSLRRGQRALRRGRLGGQIRGLFLRELGPLRGGRPLRHGAGRGGRQRADPVCRDRPCAHR